MTIDPPGGENARAREQRLDALYAAHGRSVLAYAVRRAADEHDAADALAETFLVAWRRLDDIPSGDQALMWLYAVARRILANQKRGERRRQRLAERLGGELVSALERVAPSEPAAVPIVAALAGLGPDDREIVLLAAWEELSPNKLERFSGSLRSPLAVVCIAHGSDSVHCSTTRPRSTRLIS